MAITTAVTSSSSPTPVSPSCEPSHRQMFCPCTPPAYRNALPIVSGISTDRNPSATENHIISVAHTRNHFLSRISYAFIIFITVAIRNAIMKKAAIPKHLLIKNSAIRAPSAPA